LGRTRNGNGLLIYLLNLERISHRIDGGENAGIFGTQNRKTGNCVSQRCFINSPDRSFNPGAITLAFPDSLSGISNPGFHGISQVMYEYASAAANNGSGLEGLADSQPAPTGVWWNLSTCFSLLLGRYVPIIALLFLADSMTNKQLVPETTGTLRTDSVLFTSVTAGVILILGALTFFPVLALGPIAEGYEISSSKLEAAPITAPTPLPIPSPKSGQ
jgi:K+-transporting ATPase ATPase A chain